MLFYHVFQMSFMLSWFVFEVSLTQLWVQLLIGVPHQYLCIRKQVLGIFDFHKAVMKSAFLIEIRQVFIDF